MSAPELTKTYLYYPCFLIFLSSHEVARDLSSADPGDTGSHVTVHVSPAYSTRVQCTVHVYYILLYVPENNTEIETKHILLTCLFVL